MSPADQILVYFPIIKTSAAFVWLKEKDLLPLFHKMLEGLELDIYSGTSLIRSPMGLGKSNPNGEVTILQEANLLCSVEYN